MPIDLWQTIGLSAALAMLVATFSKQLGDSLKVVDLPDGQRKLHEHATPLVGGLAFFAAFMANVAFWRMSGTADFIGTTPLIFGAFVFFGTGYMDDRRHLHPTFRLSALCVAGGFVTVAEPTFLLTELDFHFLNVSVPLGFFAAPFTVFTLLCFQNAANMSDGVNGLFLGLTLVWIALLAPWLHGGYILYFASIGAVSLTLLLPNITGRLFTGDSGTYLVSFLVCLGSISLYNSYNGEMPAEYLAVVFLIPVLDLGRVMVTRIVNGSNPFKGDRSHLQHILIAMTGKRRHAVALYLLLNLMPALYLLIDELNLLLLGTVQLSAYGLIILSRWFLTRRPNTAE